MRLNWLNVFKFETIQVQAACAVAVVTGTIATVINIINLNATESANLSVQTASTMFHILCKF